MLNYNPSVNQFPLSVSLVVASGMLGKFSAEIRQWSSSAKASKNILMFLSVFDTSTVAEKLSAVDIMFKRGR